MGSVPLRSVLPHLTASAVVLDAATRHVLLVRDVEGPRWRLVRGHVEGGEPLAEAARREVREQTHLTRVRLVEPHVAVQQDQYACDGFDARHIDHVFLGLADASTDIDEALPGGLTAAAWFALDELPEPLDPGVRLHLAQAMRAAAAL